jgi:hypothetical protein
VADSCCSGRCLECQVSINVVADSCCSGRCLECQVSVNVGENEGSELRGEWQVRHYSIWKIMHPAPHTFPPWGEWQVRHYSIWKTMLSVPHTFPPWGELLRGNSYLKVVQKVPKCDVTLLSIYSSDWSQKGKFNSCNIITLDV